MPSIAAFRVLTFDCYGTLIDWERGILATLAPWAVRHELALSDETLLETFGEIETQCETEMPRALYPEVLAEVFRRLATRWSVQVDAQAAADFGRSVPRWPPFADSAAALQSLKKHCKLAVLSNVDRESFAHSQTKLGVAFDLVVTAQDVGSYKPDIRNFEFALARVRETLGASPADVLHVAQSVFHDIVPAKSIGLHTAWVNRRQGLPGWGATPAPRADGDAARPDFEVSSLGELAALRESVERVERNPS